MGLTLRDRSAKGCLRSVEGECWIDREVGRCEFKDARLGDRFRKLLTQIGSAMGQSIPLVCQDWANTKAAYRFFSNDLLADLIDCETRPNAGVLQPFRCFLESFNR
jgi:hypothetical protein